MISGDTLSKNRGLAGSVDLREVTLARPLQCISRHLDVTRLADNFSLGSRTKNSKGDQWPPLLQIVIN